MLDSSKNLAGLATFRADRNGIHQTLSNAQFSQKFSKILQNPYTIRPCFSHCIVETCLIVSKTSEKAVFLHSEVVMKVVEMENSWYSRFSAITAEQLWLFCTGPVVCIQNRWLGSEFWGIGGRRDG